MSVSNNEEYVVTEDKEWKVYRLKESFNIDEKIASLYDILGWMYLEGKGVDKNSNEAISMFNNSVKFDSKDSDYHYDLGYALSEVGRYDESLASLNKCLELSKDDKKSQSSAHNVIGVVYLSNDNIEKAKEHFQKALELNSNNEYAKTNLSALNE
ncbi:tetratricopeptide repeat/Sel1 repeat [Gottschalkia purinilytica]|uniref:Tetratricopeptide repeat/Sel1 repeat n=1 Tax=Gottschalkia purinilytica TaxID=1503 RepID=A0A0L0WF92_GOTPU|nr:tetratricopeptide repeat protein [Gottschalkia purinilytica]KNF10101.1 tetratricopeptide repeat/Sel1 repeat [Gottschalkia purinilytica]